MVRPPNECPEYDIKKSDGEAPVMLELWGMLSTSSLPSLFGLLWAGVVTPNRVLLSMGQIELSANNLCIIELFKIELFDHLPVYKQMIAVELNC